MSSWRLFFFLGAIAATVCLIDPAVASAENYINFGTDKSSCKAAEKKAKDAGRKDSDCFKTDSGTYTLYLSD